MAEVACLLHRLQDGVAEKRGEAVGVVAGAEAVLATVDDERRRLDAGQLRLQRAEPRNERLMQFGEGRQRGAGAEGAGEGADHGRVDVPRLRISLLE